MTDKRLKLADIEIENNGGTDLAAYDLKVGRKNTAVDAFGNLTADKSAVSSGKLPIFRQYISEAIFLIFHYVF